MEDSTRIASLPSRKQLDSSFAICSIVTRYVRPVSVSTFTRIVSEHLPHAELITYQVENSLLSTTLYRSDGIVTNTEIAPQLQAGAQQTT